jgi:hypothetical protein
MYRVHHGVLQASLTDAQSRSGGGREGERERERDRCGLMTTPKSQCCQPSKEGVKKNQQFSKVSKQPLGSRRPEAEVMLEGDQQNGRQPHQRGQVRGPLLSNIACEAG